MHHSRASRGPFSNVFAILLLAAFIQGAAAGSPVTRDANDICTNRDSSDININAPICAIPGQTDLYGFGVRVGIYLTWISSWLANNFVADEMPGSLDTNSIFLFALTLTVAVLSFMETIWIIDSIILLQLSYGFLLGVMTIWGRRTKFYNQGHFGGWGTHCRLALCLAVCVYSLWFWSKAILDPDPDCFLREQCGGLRTFFFASFSASGGIHIFYAIATGLGTLYFGVMAIVAAITAVYHVISRDKSWKPIEHRGPGGLGVQGSKTFYIALSVFNLFWIVFTMLIVEFTLNLNHVSGVLADAGIANAGQLIPLLIGITSTLRICYIMYNDNILERRKRKTEDRDQVEMGTIHASEEVKTGGSPSLTAGQRQRRWWYQILTLWLPWLSCYQSWRDLNGASVVASSAGATATTEDAARRGSYTTLKNSLMSVKGYGDGIE